MADTSHDNRWQVGRTAYTHGCRCTGCCDAHSDFQAARYRTGTIPPGGSHGLSGYNNYGCKCPVCKQAKKIANAARYADSRLPSPAPVP